MIILSALVAFLCGCGEHEEEVIDYITGKTHVEQYKKAESVLKGVDKTVREDQGGIEW